MGYPPGSGVPCPQARTRLYPRIQPSPGRCPLVTYSPDPRLSCTSQWSHVAVSSRILPHGPIWHTVLHTCRSRSDTDTPELYEYWGVPQHSPSARHTRPESSVVPDGTLSDDSFYKTCSTLTLISLVSCCSLLSVCTLCALQSCTCTECARTAETEYTQTTRAEDREDRESVALLSEDAVLTHSP